MSKIVKLKKGFDIKLVGKAEKKLMDFRAAQTFAIKPTDFVGMHRPKVVVSEGDKVQAGSPILFDRKLEKILYTSPVSGEVVEVRRGEKRKLLEIKILADGEISYLDFGKLSESEIHSADRTQLTEQITKSGIWPQILQRPFGVVADPGDEPKAIFISCFDTHPLAPDLGFTLQGQEQYFQAGLNVLKKLTPGQVHLNI